MSIRFDRVGKSFGPKTVLQDVSFEVAPGEIFFILGKSGAGKSVTLKTIVGLLRPDSGSVWVDKTCVSTLSETELTEIRKRCGMVFQHPALLDSLSVFENVAFGLRNQDRTEAEIRKTVLRQLENVELDPEIASLYPSQISYGMQKRVSIARTIAPGPEYLLFDEPTTGLDPITTTAVTELIQGLSRRMSVTSIVVSHDMGSALRAADRILMLDQARIVALGTNQEIRQSQIPLVREFLREENLLEDDR